MQSNTESQNVPLSSSSVGIKSSTNDTINLEEEYNKWLSKVNELSDKKNELSNSIKLKNSNRELMKKARYAAVGSESPGKRQSQNKEMSFTLIQIILAFSLTLVVGLYIGTR